MALQVVGAGVGRTGTYSLKVTLERLTGEPCHHLVGTVADPDQIPNWTDAIEGRPVDWTNNTDGWRARLGMPPLRQGGRPPVRPARRAPPAQPAGTFHPRASAMSLHVGQIG